MSLKGRYYEPVEDTKSIWWEITHSTKSGGEERHYTEPGKRITQTTYPGGSGQLHSEGGHVFNFSSGHCVSYAKGGSGGTCDGSTESKSGGFSRSQSKQEGYACHAGDKSSFCGGDQAHATLGKYNHAAKQMYFGSGTTICFNAAGDCEIKSGGKLMLTGSEIHMNGVKMSGGGGGGSTG